MAPPGAGEPSSSSSSQAIQIPHFEGGPSTYTYNRRRRGRYSKIPSPIERTEQAEAGPSASSLSSDNSSWNSPPIHTDAARPVSRMGPGHASKDPRLPLRSTTEPTMPQRKGKQPAHSASSSHPLPPLFPPSTSPLSPSMLASSSYTSVNLNHHDDPDEPPRLITYTKHGQGFTWNDELFLPSYMIGRYGGSNGRGRRKQYDGDFGEDDVQVAEVFVTDEEAEAMMP